MTVAHTDKTNKIAMDCINTTKLFIFFNLIITIPQPPHGDEWIRGTRSRRPSRPLLF